jgi:hypothetical protein
MATRDLKKAEKRIAQARTNIASQHQVIQTYENAGDDAGAAKAHELLRALEQALAVLLERRQRALRNAHRAPRVF